MMSTNHEECAGIPGQLCLEATAPWKSNLFSYDTGGHPRNVVRYILQIKMDILYDAVHKTTMAAYTGDDESQIFGL